MSSMEKKLIVKAYLKFKKIFPCGTGRKFSECFTEEDATLFFWFNTEDGSTHLVKEKLVCQYR